MKNAVLIIVIVIAALLLIWIFGMNHAVAPVSTSTTTTTVETANPVTNPVVNPVTGATYPTPATNTGTTVTAKVGQNITFNGVVGTVTSVVEDSRCPTDVQCIQAGTVRVNTKLTYGTLSQTETLGLNQTFALGGHSITFLSVKPDKLSKVTINPSDYVFTFLVK